MRTICMKCGTRFDKNNEGSWCSHTPGVAHMWVAEEPTQKSHLPTDALARKNAPIARGVLDYFPLAIAAVAELSRVGNEQHNPGQPMHWARGKSTDHADCIARHLIDRGTVDTDGQRHSTKTAWRALALLQEELEGELAAVKKDKG